MKCSDVEVLRLGHRLGRDPRITTHLALVSRAMGASKFTLAGDEDEKLFENIASVNDRFGHGITCRYEKSPMKLLKGISDSDGVDKPIIIHLTMYGEPFKETIAIYQKINLLSLLLVVLKSPLSFFH